MDLSAKLVIANAYSKSLVRSLYCQAKRRAWWAVRGFLRTCRVFPRGQVPVNRSRGRPG